MALMLYSSLAKKEEDFDAYMAGRKTVSMYSCGPTVYSRPHIGNYSAFLMADLLRRWLEVKGYTVTHVKNITDVGHLLHDADQGDDKIQKQAEKEKLHPLDIAKRYTEQYLDDEKTLKLLEPAHRPRATEYVEQMKDIISTLLEKGHAYVTDDGIYFDVTSDTPTPYGSLSGNTLENVAAGSRVEVNERKRHPADFALWKFCVGPNAHHVLRWASPKITQPHPFAGAVPEGFPGWHIECSAMSSALLGEQIDIHTGGEDNIFPHHECEIAQSESATGKKPFVRFWLHKRRIDLEGEKMSKSLGNVLNIPDILGRNYSSQDLRYYFLSVHYRTNLKFSWKGMDDAKIARKKIVEWMQELKEDLSDLKSEPEVFSQYQRAQKEGITAGSFSQKFIDSMDGDLNVSAAIASLFEAMSWHRNLAFTGAAFYDLEQLMLMAQKTFGCFDAETEEIPSDVQELVDARKAAREAKNFAESDRLRDEIAKRGFEVRDSAQGQTVKKL